MKHVVMFSGGLGSWATAKRVVQAHGMADLTLLCQDTLIEDEDSYRFIPQAAANVFGLSLESCEPLRSLWESIPALEDMEGPEGMELRAARLSALRDAAMRLIPGLVWEAEGRDPWQVYFDERMLGNSRRDPCSKILKRRPADRWHEANGRRDSTVIYVGIDWSEEHRFTNPDPNEPGLKERRAAQGWRYEAPMCDPPYMDKGGMKNWARKEGLKPPRLYEMGFVRNNCGGFCCKAGQGHFKRLLETMPRRYAYHERREQEIRAHLGKDVSMMREQRGGEKTPLTLLDLRKRLEAGGQCDLFDWGGCHCFAGSE